MTDQSSTMSPLHELLATDPELAGRMAKLKQFSAGVRTSEYHLTNACNIRCTGCWFFSFEFDHACKEASGADALRAFVSKEVQRGVNAALLIGGEPTLFPERIATYVEAMEYVTVSTNGLRPLPQQGFERVAIAISLFGGGPLDDELRAIKPNGKRFTGLFHSALANYAGDPRATFVYALTDAGIEYIDDTVRRIQDNGNLVTFNFYSKYGSNDPLRVDSEQRLLEKALEVRERYPDTVLSTPYYIHTMISGKSHWDKFSYEVCPSISVDHPAHSARLQNGNRSLPLFNTYGADLKTVQFCCTSGHCDDCRDSQAVFSWLLVSLPHFSGNARLIKQWADLAESYWAQFVWSPYHRSARALQKPGNTAPVKASPKASPLLVFPGPRQ